MTTRFSMIRDINGYNGFGLQFSDSKYGVLLAQDVEQTLTIPVNPDGIYKNYLAIFSVEPGTNIWIALNATATYPSGAVAAINSELNPTARYIKGDGEQILHFITSDTQARLGIVLYAVQ